jgi:CDP-paratose 2-epimerase
MKVAIITGSAGLIGSESVRFFSDKMDLVVGIDNDQRAYFFGKDASTDRSKEQRPQTLKSSILAPAAMAAFSHLG